MPKRNSSNEEKEVSSPPAAPKKTKTSRGADISPSPSSTSSSKAAALLSSSLTPHETITAKSIFANVNRVVLEDLILALATETDRDALLASLASRASVEKKMKEVEPTSTASSLTTASHVLTDDLLVQTETILKERIKKDKTKAPRPPRNDDADNNWDSSLALQFSIGSLPHDHVTANIGRKAHSSSSFVGAYSSLHPPASLPTPPRIKKKKKKKFPANPMNQGAFTNLSRFQHLYIFSSLNTTEQLRTFCVSRSFATFRIEAELYRTITIDSTAAVTYQNYSPVERQLGTLNTKRMTNIVFETSNIYSSNLADMAQQLAGRRIDSSEMERNAFTTPMVTSLVLGGRHLKSLAARKFLVYGDTLTNLTCTDETKECDIDKNLEIMLTKMPKVVSLTLPLMTKSRALLIWNANEKSRAASATSLDDVAATVCAITSLAEISPLKSAKHDVQSSLDKPKRVRLSERTGRSASKNAFNGMTLFHQFPHKFPELERVVLYHNCSMLNLPSPGLYSALTFTYLTSVFLDNVQLVPPAEFAPVAASSSKKKARGRKKKDFASKASVHSRGATTFLYVPAGAGIEEDDDPYTPLNDQGSARNVVRFFDTLKDQCPNLTSLHVCCSQSSTFELCRNFSTFSR
jgi:hypothetical protein